MRYNSLRNRRFIPQETLQETRDLPYPNHFKCSEGHSGPFRPIRIEEGRWLQCRYLDPERKPGVGYCDYRFLIQESNELLILLVSPEMYAELEKRDEVADYLRNDSSRTSCR